MTSSGRACDSRISGVVVFAAAVLLTFSRPAQAGAPLCYGSQVLPVDRAVVPASLPVLGFAPGSARSGADGSTSAPSISLVDDLGVAVALQATAAQFAGRFQEQRLGVALQEGRTYTITRSDPCSNGGPEPYAAASAVTRFTAGPAAPWPTSLGTLTAQPAIRESVTVPGIDTIFRIDGAYVDLVLTLDPTLRPFAPVALFEAASLDGIAVTSTSTPSAYPVGGSTGDTRTFRVLVGCDPVRRQALEPPLAEGTHKVEIRGAVLGMPDALPPAKITVSIDCATAKRGTACDPDQPGCPVSGSIGGSVLDAGTGVESAATSVTADAGVATETQGSGGCALAGRPAGTSGWLVLLGAALLVRRRRRR